ncbi:hypothetical protein PPL_02721 [Heterostelium album PN500]|uniref:Uncharacterized protein n=1 Tax=Heterostelium pallidum (strain ATCC 26659 / Pp 5 / PN500) TaxID=670386 RepID=D3B2V7_HETP5|nr:hypothetical protein PPL_02721 [Heterostelium album PN500]EFA83655.1 hypothetical protein PPL_02721 [Heterostelium album PN500]|eukprot:XP_020435772.1 hypothetical protein PPL_02721 [Heterostelium album PN500]
MKALISLLLLGIFLVLEFDDDFQLFKALTNLDRLGRREQELIIEEKNLADIIQYYIYNKMIQDLGDLTYPSGGPTPIDPTRTVPIPINVVSASPPKSGPQEISLTDPNTKPKSIQEPLDYWNAQAFKYKEIRNNNPDNFEKIFNF